MSETIDISEVEEATETSPAPPPEIIDPGMVGQVTRVDPAVIQEMIDHYHAKIEGAADRIALFSEDLQPGAETLVVSYGVTSRSAAVAVRRADGSVEVKRESVKRLSEYWKPLSWLLSWAFLPSILVVQRIIRELIYSGITRIFLPSCS